MENSYYSGAISRYAFLRLRQKLKIIVYLKRVRMKKFSLIASELSTIIIYGQNVCCELRLKKIFLRATALQAHFTTPAMALLKKHTSFAPKRIFALLL
jgi:hypothetical protein